MNVKQQQRRRNEFFNSSEKKEINKQIKYTGTTRMYVEVEVKVKESVAK